MGVSLGAYDEGYVRGLVAARLVELLGPDPDVLLELELRAELSAAAARWGEDGHRTVLLDGRPVGRVWTAPDGDVVRVVDLLVEPGERSHGVGGVVVALLLAQGRSLVAAVPEHDLRARTFWARAGFAQVDAPEEAGRGRVLVRHEGWTPPPLPVPAPLAVPVAPRRPARSRSWSF